MTSKPKLGPFRLLASAFLVIATLSFWVPGYLAPSLLEYTAERPVYIYLCFCVHMGALWALCLLWRRHFLYICVVWLVLNCGLSYGLVIHKVRAHLRDTACDNNLVRVRDCMLLYAEDNGGYLPPSLESLLDPSYGCTEEDIQCPKTGEPYIYFFKGQHRKTKELGPWEVTVAEHGYPHYIGEWVKWTMSVKGAVLPISKEEVAARLEKELGRSIREEDLRRLDEEPARLAVVLGELQRELERRNFP